LNEFTKQMESDKRERYEDKIWKEGCVAGFCIAIGVMMFFAVLVVLSVLLNL